MPKEEVLKDDTGMVNDIRMQLIRKGIDQLDQDRIGIMTLEELQIWENEAEEDGLGTYHYTNRIPKSIVDGCKEYGAVLFYKKQLLCGDPTDEPEFIKSFCDKKSYSEAFLELMNFLDNKK